MRSAARLCRALAGAKRQPALVSARPAQAGRRVVPAFWQAPPMRKLWRAVRLRRSRQGLPQPQRRQPVCRAWALPRPGLGCSALMALGRREAGHPGPFGLCASSQTSSSVSCGHLARPVCSLCVLPALCVRGGCGRRRASRPPEAAGASGAAQAPARPGRAGACSALGAGVGDARQCCASRAALPGFSLGMKKDSSSYGEDLSDFSSNTIGIFL